MKYASKILSLFFCTRCIFAPPAHAHRRTTLTNYIHLCFANGGGGTTGVLASLSGSRGCEAAATASNLWPLRMDSHAPSSASRVRRRESWTRGGLARRDTGQTLSDIGRERAAGRTCYLRSARASSNATRYFQIQNNATILISKTISFFKIICYCTWHRC